MPFLGKVVDFVCDRPIGTKHPQWAFIYEVNYGYVPNTHAPDGEALDAYYLGVTERVASAKGMCIAIIHRFDDDDDKLVLVPPNVALTDDEILRSTHFQEKYFDVTVLRWEKP